MAVGLICSVLISKYFKNHPKVASSDEEITKQTLSYETGTGDANSLNNIDTDNDGLKDWEELLWATDANKKDTDGDGTPDGEEVKDGRDPLKKGPNDFLSQYNSDSEVSASVNSKSNVSDTSLTASDVFSQQLFSQYMSLKNSGGEENPENTANLVDNLTSQALSSFSFREYNATGLSLFPGNDKDQLKFYSSSFALLQLDFLKKVQEATASIKTDADLKNLSKVYNAFALALYQMKVPQEIFPNHLRVVNNISTVASVFDAVSKYKTDPVPAISALKAYQMVQKDQRENMSAIAAFLRNSGIIWTDGTESNFWRNF